MDNIFLIISFIPVILLVIIGILIKYKKAYWLISGYNTMSSEKKKNVDKEGLGRFIGNVCFFIAGIIFIANVFIFTKKVVISMIIYVALLPTVIYVLVKSQRYDGNSWDENGNMNKKTKITIGIISGFLILVTLGVGVLMYYSSQPAEYNIRNGMLEISGLYGQKILLSEITDIELKNFTPEVKSKTNGSHLGTKLKGYFNLKDIGNAKLFIDESKKTFIYLHNDSKLIILNCDDINKTEELYYRLKAEITSNTENKKN